MTRVSNISHIPHFVTQVHQVSVYNIKSDKWPCVTQVAFAAYCWSALHTYQHDQASTIRRFLFALCKNYELLTDSSL